MGCGVEDAVNNADCGVIFEIDQQFLSHVKIIPVVADRPPISSLPTTQNPEDSSSQDSEFFP